MEWEETCSRFIRREGLAVSRMGRHRKLLSQLIVSSLPHDAKLFCHQYCGKNIKMMEEGVDVEAFLCLCKIYTYLRVPVNCAEGSPKTHLCVKFTLM